MTANITDTLSLEEKRALLAQLLEKEISKPALFPLSFSQQRVWFFDQWEPQSPVYNIPAAIGFRGALDIKALQRTLDEIVRRHEALRTTFPATDTDPLQLISPPAPFPLEFLDLSMEFADLDQAAQDARVAQLITREATRPFDLTHGPLFRGLLLQLSERHFVLVLNMHHIVSDGWSLGVLVNEVTSLYTSYHQGQPPSLPELPLQYADFAVWQREWLTGAVLEEQLSYWRAQLGGTLPALQLLSDKARPAVQTYQGATASRALPRQLCAEVKALTQREGATLFMTLLAAFQVLLYRYTGQQDILVGTPIAGRSRPELELLIGFFTNTLVMRTEVVGEMNFVQLLGRVRETALGAYAHQDVPFEKLVQELQPERDMSRQPLFQVMFILQNATIPPLELPDVTLEVLGVETGTAKFDLTLIGEEREDGQIMMTVEYNRDLYGAESIERLLGHYERLLEGVVAEPERAVGRYDILGVEERAQLLSGWGAQRREYERGATLGELLSEAARAHAERGAVAYEGKEISYAELWERSNRLGRYLQREGVEPETIVAVMMERSLEMVVALVAVVKAGGAYLPIEPSQPPERMEYMLRDAGVELLLSQEQLLDRLPPHEARVICIDSEWEVISRVDAADIDSGVPPDNAAYVIYTSGSTGQPKGAINTHRGITNRLLWMQEQYELTPADGVLQKTPFGFDVSVWEFFWPLMTGARLVVARPNGHQDSAYLAKLIEEQQITTLHFVPSMLQVFLEEELLEQRCRSVKRTICSGEALPAHPVRRFYERIGGATLYNLYGPTEAAVDVTYWECPRELPDQTVPIGRPIANTQIYILDANLEPVPIGVPGELHIGGVGLARGYLARPELTAEKFIPDPFSTEVGARIYKTGDLARYQPDGNIEYLGRLDHQVKIRGFRIELGEIEYVLRQHPAVHETVLMARQDGGLEKRLVAYLTTAQESAPNVSELRSFLKERLPEYMIPSAFVVLDQIPLSANGKVDRRALPAPDQTRPNLKQEYEGPRNEIEQLLTGIWQEVLGINPIGIHDDYFALGGDSIRVVQIVNKAKAYNLSMAVKDIFQAPTVCKLASRISDHKDEGRERIPLELIELPQHVRASLPDDIEDAYPISRMQELMLFHYVHDTQGMGVYHVQQWFRIQDETLSITALKQSLKMLVQKHPVLRTVFLNVDGMRLQAVKKTIDFQVAEEDISALTEPQQEAYLDAAIRKDRVTLFNLNNEPQFMFKIFKRSESDIEFLMKVNHAISDGWGNIEFLKELFQLYQSTKTDGEVVLPVAINSFKEFIAMEHEILASDEAKSFWQEHLKNENHRPLQRIAVADEPSADNLNYVLDTELTTALQSLARSQKVSLKTIYLSAYHDIVAKVQGQRTATIGVVSNGRSERLTDPFKSLGLFWNMVPVCAPIDSENKLAQLANVQQLLIDVEPYSRYPLSQIVENQGKSELLFASLNFLNFHNAKNAWESEEVKVPSSGGHDKFHYPLNLVVSVNPNSGDVWLRVEYDRAYFSFETVEAMTDEYIAHLKSLAFAPEKALVTAAS